MKRIYHTWEKWECYPAGFYDEKPRDGRSHEEGEEAYREFLSDLAMFEIGLQGVISTWKNSCEHYLTNERMNRIAWLGQAAAAYSMHMPSSCRGGYNKLTPEEQVAADALALKYLNAWLTERGEAELTPETAKSRTEADLY